MQSRKSKFSLSILLFWTIVRVWLWPVSQKQLLLFFIENIFVEIFLQIWEFWSAEFERKSFTHRWNTFQWLCQHQRRSEIHMNMQREFDAWWPSTWELVAQIITLWMWDWHWLHVSCTSQQVNLWLSLPAWRSFSIWTLQLHRTTWQSSVTWTIFTGIKLNFNTLSIPLGVFCTLVHLSGEAWWYDRQNVCARHRRHLLNKKIYIFYIWCCIMSRNSGFFFCALP
jgi:hypothetical protein